MRSPIPIQSNLELLQLEIGDSLDLGPYSFEITDIRPRSVILKKVDGTIWEWKLGQNLAKLQRIPRAWDLEVLYSVTRVRLANAVYQAAILPAEEFKRAKGELVEATQALARTLRGESPVKYSAIALEYAEKAAAVAQTSFERARKSSKLPRWELECGRLTSELASLQVELLKTQRDLGVHKE